MRSHSIKPKMKCYLVWNEHRAREKVHTIVDQRQMENVRNCNACSRHKQINAKRKKQNMKRLRKEKQFYPFYQWKTNDDIDFKLIASIVCICHVYLRQHMIFSLIFFRVDSHFPPHSFYLLPLTRAFPFFHIYFVRSNWNQYQCLFFELSTILIRKIDLPRLTISIRCTVALRNQHKRTASPN